MVCSLGSGIPAARILHAPCIFCSRKPSAILECASSLGRRAASAGEGSWAQAALQHKAFVLRNGEEVPVLMMDAAPNPPPLPPRAPEAPSGQADYEATQDSLSHGGQAVDAPPRSSSWVPPSCVCPGPVPPASPACHYSYLSLPQRFCDDKSFPITVASLH